MPDHARPDLLGHRHRGPTFAGDMTFLRRVRTRDIRGADIVVSGIPFDSATSFRPGARFGPNAIRAASAQLAELAGHAFPFDMDPFATLAVADWGDCPLDYGHPEAVVDEVEAHARSILAEAGMMVTFGGDHFISYPLLRAHAERHGPLALVHFDAHVDTWPDDDGRLDHGSMFLRAKREGLLDVEHSVQVGIRSYSAERAFTVLDAPWVHDNGTAAALERILAVVGNRKAYLTVDIDCLDPAHAPGTGTPVPGGLTSAQLLALIRGLGPLDIVGLDVVEVSPPYDHAEITALAAATVAHDFICLQALKSRNHV
ncbi:MAG: agmatinase [Pseudomonadales bacterium]|nr:agmatinase [Pseudomonadales bacterium]